MIYFLSFNNFSRKASNASEYVTKFFFFVSTISPESPAAVAASATAAADIRIRYEFDDQLWCAVNYQFNVGVVFLVPIYI